MKRNITNLIKFSGLLATAIAFSGLFDVGNADVLAGKVKPNYLLKGTLVRAEIPENEDFSTYFDYYSITGLNGKYAVSLKTDYKNSSYTGSISIPDRLYDDNDIIGIYRSGFKGSYFSTVIIPESITTIDYEAFLGSHITNITIPNTVSAIGDGAFYSCKSLETATFSNSSSSESSTSICTCVPTVSSSGGPSLKKIPSFCFFNCYSLTELILPYTIEEVGYEAFNGCINLSSTISFQNIKVIQSRAFQNCGSLNAVYLPKSFFELEDNGSFVGGTMGEHAFAHCNNNLRFVFAGTKYEAGVSYTPPGEQNAVTVNNSVEKWCAKNSKLGWSINSASQTPNEDGHTYEFKEGSIFSSGDWEFSTNGNDVTILKYIGNTSIANTSYLSIPNHLPLNDTTKNVVDISNQALDPIKDKLERIYLPTTLKYIPNEMFNDDFTVLRIVASNADCASTDAGSRIDLSKLTQLEIIGDRAFSEMHLLTGVTSLHLPYSLVAVGNQAFGKHGTSQFLRKVTSFAWDFKEGSSTLQVIGHDAFFNLGRDVESTTFDNNSNYQNSIDANGSKHFETTTIVFPKTFKHTGITSDDVTNIDPTHNPSYLAISETASLKGHHAFAGCPLIEKVVFKGTDQDVLSSNGADTSTYDLVLGVQTFAFCESLRTVVFEERKGHTILFHTDNGTYAQPCIGSSSGRFKNDFGGDPALQTLVLPNVYTTIGVQHCAFQGNSRGVIYLSGDKPTDSNSNNFVGNTCQNLSTSIDDPNNSINGHEGYITDLTNVQLWHTIGDESFYDGATNANNDGYLGYCFNTNVSTYSATVPNTYGLDQRMPIYGNVYYHETITQSNIKNSSNGNLQVTVGSSNNTYHYVETEEKVLSNGENPTVTNHYGKYAFLCYTESSTDKAIMTKFLYDRHEAKFTGLARVPDKVSYSSKEYSVVKIGASAFSAAFCDNTKYTVSAASGFSDLTTVQLPDSIETIGEYAFMRAYRLNEITAYGRDANNAISVKSQYTMPSSLTKVGKNAFSFCNVVQFLKFNTNILFFENITLSTDLDEMGESATSYYDTSVFSNNFSLRKITFGNNSASSTYYETTVYQHSAGVNYTNALYSKTAAPRNSQTLLLVLYRNCGQSGDESKTSSDVTSLSLEDGTVKFTAKYSTNPFLYGAFKMAYWLDGLILSNPTLDGNNNILRQPLFSGIYDRANNRDSYIYLNNPIKDYTTINTDLISIGLSGNSSGLDFPEYALEGCNNLQEITLPRIVGATIPAGLFSKISAAANNNALVIKVPDPEYVVQAGDANNNSPTGMDYVDTSPTLDLTNTGYVGIGADAFKELSGYTKFVAPKLDASKTFTINTNAFYKSSFEEIDFSNVKGKVVLNESAFQSCSKLKRIDFTGVKEVVIGKKAFHACQALQEIDFTDVTNSVTLGESSFQEAKLNYNTYSNSNYSFKWSSTATVTFNYRAFYKCGFATHKFELPAKITNTIGDQCFAECNVTSCALGEVSASGDLTSLQYIGIKAFAYCRSLTSFCFDKCVSLKEIRENGFRECTNLGGVIDFPATLHLVGRYAFMKTSITGVYFNSNDTNFLIYRLAFYGCTLLTIIYFNNPNCKWVNTALDSNDHFSGCTSLTELWLPNVTLNRDGTVGNGGGGDGTVNSWSYINGDTNVKIYTNSTYAAAPALTQNKWRDYEAPNNHSAPIVFYTKQFSDLSSSTCVGQEFWTYQINDPTNPNYSTLRSAVVLLGKVVAYDSVNSIAYFENGYMLSGSTFTQYTRVSNSSEVVVDNTTNYCLTVGTSSIIDLGTATNVDQYGTITFSSGHTLTGGYLDATVEVAVSVSDLLSNNKISASPDTVIDNTTVFVIVDNNNVVVLGVITGYDSSTGTVTFSSGYTLNGSTFIAPSNS